MAKFHLISFALCPYVQRAAILLAEKGVEFERINIDLANKPDWFLKPASIQHSVWHCQLRGLWPERSGWGMLAG